jgi:hypothetical protein
MQDEDTSVLFKNMQEHVPCMTKIKTSDGAPGFNLSTNTETGNLILSWAEYDLNLIEIYINVIATEWPALYENFVEVSCLQDNSCQQGSTFAMVTEDGTHYQTE